MSDAPPIRFRYEGEGEFKATSVPWGRAADRHYTIGQEYDLVEHHERSSASHRHFFAVVNEAWANLPEALAEQFPSPDHLRRYALIKSGFCDSRTLPCASKAEAQRVAAFIRPTDEYSIVTVKDAVVTHYVAHSQSMKAMGRDTFKDSKDGVLRILSEMLGTTAKELLGAMAT